MHSLSMIRSMCKGLLITISNRHQLVNSSFLKCESSGVNQLALPLALQSQFMSIFDAVMDKQDDKNLKPTIRRKAVTTLMEILQIDRKSAQFIILEYSIFTKTAKQVIMTNYERLKTAGANKEFILDNITLLAQNPSELDKKLGKVLGLVDQISEVSALLGCNDKKIDQILDVKHAIAEQILDIKKRFQIGKEDVNIIILKYLTQMKSEPHGTLKKIELLLDHGVSLDDLKKKEWPLSMSYQKLEARLMKYKQIGLEVKAYTMAYSEDEFERKIKSVEDRNKYSDQLAHLFRHLSEKSGYNTSLIRSRWANSKVPDGQSRNKKPKINFDDVYKIIDDILAEGYEYTDIINCLKVLSLPRSSINERFKMLKRVESKISSRAKAPILDDLTLSDEEFEKYLCNKR